MPTRRRVALIWMAVWAAAASAPAGAAGPPAEVAIRDQIFTPARVQVKAGSTVRWTNHERRTSHSVLFFGEGGFESERLLPGESWERRFDKPGRYAYGCGPHPDMKGEIIVTD